MLWSFRASLAPWSHRNTVWVLGTYTRAPEKEVAGAFTTQGWEEALLLLTGTSYFSCESTMANRQPRSSGWWLS